MRSASSLAAALGRAPCRLATWLCSFAELLLLRLRLLALLGHEGRVALREGVVVAWEVVQLAPSMSTMSVQTWLRKCWSCETTSSVSLRLAPREVVLQPDARVEVEVVGRLVEQQ